MNIKFQHLMSIYNEIFDWIDTKWIISRSSLDGLLDSGKPDNTEIEI